MSAANDAREALEALLWERIKPSPGDTGRQTVRKLVEDILSGADKYASMAGAEALDEVFRAHRQAERQADRRAVLAEAVRRS
jgi:hypothetical protein